MKFKVGDLVRIVGNSCLHKFEIGETARIIAINNSHSYKAEHLDERDWWNIDENDAVLVNKKTESMSVLRGLERYIIKEDACIVFWKDGSKTIVKKMAKAKHNKELAFLTAYFQKHSGLSKTKANKFLSELEETKQPKKKVK